MGCYERNHHRFVLRYLTHKFGHEDAFMMLRNKTIPISEEAFIVENIIPKRLNMAIEKASELLDKVVDGLKKKPRTILLSHDELRDLNNAEEKEKSSKPVSKPSVPKPSVPKPVQTEKVQCKAIKMDNTRCKVMVIGGCLCKRHSKKN